jgi:hypothetical protein
MNENIQQEKNIASAPKESGEFITKEEYDFRMREIAKCKRDIEYFADNYYKLINLDTGLTQMKMYGVQRGLLKHFTENNRAIVCSARQMGKCVRGNAKIKIRDKVTGEISKIEIGELYKQLA